MDPRIPSGEPVKVEPVKPEGVKPEGVKPEGVSVADASVAAACMRAYHSKSSNSYSMAAQTFIREMMIDTLLFIYANQKRRPSCCLSGARN